MNIEELKFPIGTYKVPHEITSETISNWINSIEKFPKAVLDATANLSVEQLNWVYRPNGWTIKQVVHHCADSHLNSMARFKLALTEDNPTIRPYEEQLWAELPDSLTNDITDSILLLNGLHAKWVYLLYNLSKKQLKRTYIHPGHDKQFTIEYTIGSYAWHCNHHLAHIHQAIKFENKF